MISFIFIISLILSVIFLYSYYKTREGIYVPDKRFKTGRRFSHYRNFTKDEIDERKLKYRKPLKISLIIFSISFILSLIFKDKETINNTKEASLKDSKGYSFELISSNKNNIVENYYIQFNSKDLSKEFVEKSLREIKLEICKKNCNISAYDDKRYYEQEEEMKSKKEALALKFTNQKITKSEYKKELDKIDKEYYVNIAEHLIGFLEFEDNGLFLYYPYKDWRYKELGGKSLKK